MAPERTIHVVVFRQSGRWVAQCLEVNLAVSSENQEELLAVLTRRIQGQMIVDARRGIEPLSGLRPANPRYRAMWEKSRALPSESRRVSVPLRARLLAFVKRVEWPSRELELAAVRG